MSTYRDLHLNEDDRLLFTYYSNLYNQTMNHINLLYDELNDLREIIDYITRVNLRNNMQTNMLLKVLIKHLPLQYSIYDIDVFLFQVYLQFLYIYISFDFPFFIYYIYYIIL